MRPGPARRKKDRPRRRPASPPPGPGRLPEESVRLSGLGTLRTRRTAAEGVPAVPLRGPRRAGGSADDHVVAGAHAHGEACRDVARIEERYVIVVVGRIVMK